MTELQHAFDLSLSVENDANLAALGERSFGWGSSASTFVYITIGTGVGMGIVINGTLYRGARGAAGEIGFLPFALDEDLEESEKISDTFLGMLIEQIVICNYSDTLFMPPDGPPHMNMV